MSVRQICMRCGTNTNIASQHSRASRVESGQLFQQHIAAALAASVIMGGNNGLKFIAVAVLLEYVFIKPRIMLGGDGTDFVGIVLVHAVSAPLCSGSGSGS